MYYASEKLSVGSREMTTTALFGDVERFGLLWVQIVALEVDVDVDVAVDYIELVVPVILS